MKPPFWGQFANIHNSWQHYSMHVVRCSSNDVNNHTHLHQKDTDMIHGQHAQYHASFSLNKNPDTEMIHGQHAQYHACGLFPPQQKIHTLPKFFPCTKATIS